MCDLESMKEATGNRSWESPEGLLLALTEALPFLDSSPVKLQKAGYKIAYNPWDSLNDIDQVSGLI